MQHVLSMRLAGRTGHEASGQRTDPVRRLVQVILVAYLSPVILAVLVIGGIAVAGTRVATAAQNHLARWK